MKMNKIFKKVAVLSVGLTMAIGAAVVLNAGLKAERADAAVAPILTFDFEDSTAHRTSGSNSYTGSNSYSENGVDISLMYADSVTTGTPLSGSANITARVAKNTTNSPYMIIGPMDLSSFNIASVSYLSKSVNSLTVASSYSLDGSAWTALESHVGNSNANTYSKDISIEEPGSFYLKFQVTITTGVSTTSNRDTLIDNVVISGESTGGAVALDGISCDPQSVDVTSTLDLASKVSFSPSDATNKNLSFAVTSGAANIDMTEAGVITGKKGGTSKVTITPEDTSGDATAIEVTITINSIAAPGISDGEQYVLYAVDATNGNFELTGLASSLGTAAAFTGDIPACSYVLDVEEGYYENTVALKNGTKYLALTSAGNNLHSQTSVTANSSWIVTYDSNDNSATIFNAAFKNRSIQFNYNNGSPRFACYASEQVAISLYPYSEKALEDFTIDAEIDVYVSGTKSIGVTYEPADASDKALTWDSDNEEIATVADGVVTGVAVGTTTVTASKLINSVLVERTCTVHVLNNVSTHRGTAVDPFDVNDAVNVAKGIFVKDPDGNDISLENQYHVKGLITKNATRTTDNLSFWIGDNASQISAQTGGFEVYKAAKVYGVALATAYETAKEVAADFDVGHYVLVKAQFMLYSSTTPETVQNTADIIWSSFIEARTYGAAFNTALEAVCDGEYGDTDPEALADAWKDQKDAYTLSDEAKAIFLSIAEDGKQSGNDVEKCVAKYDYIIKKYNTTSVTVYKDFMGRVEADVVTLKASVNNNSFDDINGNNSLVLVIAIISGVSLVALSSLLILKKKRK